MPKHKKTQIAKLPTFHFRNCGDTVRVWLDSWYGDQFEVLHPDDFSTLQATGKRFGFSFVEAED